MNVLRNRILISLVLFLLLFSLIPMSPVSALVWNPGVTFNCDNEYYSVTTPLTVDNISVDTHWVSVNGLGFNVSYAGTKYYANLSSIKSYPKGSTGWILNWTAQKQAGTVAYHNMSGLKKYYMYILYNNLSGAFSKFTGATGTFTINMSAPYTNIQYSIWDAGIPAGFYVATTGSDTVGTGSLANPFATLQKAINASSTGDDIIMRGGEYHPGQCTFINRSGTALDWYTISNYTGETVIINGTNANHGDVSINATIMMRGADYVRFTGITINRSYSGGISLYSTPTTCDNIRIDNCTISNCSTFAFRSYIGNTYLYLENNYIYNNFCNWSGHSGLSQETISLSTVSYGYIYGNYLWKNHVEQIDMKSGCSWMSVHDNIINTTASRIYRNFYLAGGIGIYLDARGVSHNISIYNNLVYGNHTGIQISNEGATGRYENINIYNNILNMTNTTGGKPMPDGRLGILLGREGGSTSINKDINIYMNTINLGTGNKYANLQIGASSMHMDKNYILRLNISNNIFTNNNKTDLAWWQYLNTAHIQIFGLNSTDGDAYIKFNNNLFNNSFVGTCSPRIVWQEAGYTKTSPTKWGNSPVFTKPLYVDPHPFNAYLNVTSPCIGAATSSLVASTDYAGTIRPQAGTYEIGAYERIGGGIIPAAPTATTPGPTSNAVDRSSPIPALNITIEDLNADSMNLYFRSNHTGAWATLSSNLAVFNGTYQSLLPGFVFPGKKWWSVNVTDGAYWTNKTFNFTFIVVAPPTSGITLSHVRANWTTSASVNITWTKGANCTNTYVYRSNVGYTIGTVLLYSGTASYFNNTLLDPTVRYYYTLRPYNSVSLLFGLYHNVSLVETYDTIVTTSSSIAFKGWLATDKNIWTHFRYSSVPTFTTTNINTSILGERYNNTATSSHMAFQRENFGQQFVVGATGPNVDYYAYNVSIKAYRTGNPGDITMYISSVDGFGLPDFVSTSSGTMNGNTITTSPAGEWINFTMSPLELTAGTMYMLCLSVGSWTPNCVYWLMDDSPGIYPIGSVGVRWWYGWPTVLLPNEDFLFRIYAKIPSVIGAIGGLYTTNETITTTTSVNITQDDLSSGQLYYYLEEANDTKNNMTRGNIRTTLTNPGIPLFHSLTPYFTNNSVNITWLKGVGANRTVIVKSNIAYSDSVADGTIVYNGTGTGAWITNISFNLTYYFSMFSYTTWGDHSRFSLGIDIPWGGVTFIVYNESKPWQVINASILVTDSAGIYPRQFNNIYGYYSFNISQIPYGENTLFYISNVSYGSRLYPITIIPNIFYNFSFYLPPLHPQGENTTTENLTHDYTIYVINEQNLPVDGALVQFYRYFNTTANYTYIGGFVTDGYGMGSTILFPQNLYMVKLSCDGYQDKTDSWVPTLLESTISPSKTFKIYYEVPTNETVYDFMEQIHVTASFNNATGLLTVTYLDDMAGTLNLQIYVYDVTNGTLMLTAASILDNDVITSVTVNTTHDYEIVYKMNHTYFGYRPGILYITGWHRTITTPGKFNLLFTINFGFIPFGWSNIITWFIIIGCFFSFERRDSYMAMFLAGFFLLFLNYYIGFNTVMSIAAGGAIPIMMILFGILMLIRDRYRFGMDT